MAQRFVVTGSNGLVGSRLCALLLAQGKRVTGLGRGEQRGGTWEHVSVDLTREEEVARALDQAQPEVVIHCASMTDVDGCERDPKGAWAANVDAAAYVARGAAQARAHLVHVSTDYVFDGDAGPYDESAIPNPRGAYAMTKFAGELAARTFVPGAAIARTAVVYGWPAAGRANFGSWLVSTLSEGKGVRLFEDQFVSPSFADSVAAQLAEIGERGLGGIWNVSGSDTVDRVTFGRALCEVFGFDVGLLTPSKMKDLQLPSPRPLKSGLITEKARRELASKPLGLAESLRGFHAAWRGSR